jgi:hypothetical protein
VSLAFPSPRWCACVAVVNGVFQVQQLPLAFSLFVRYHFFPNETPLQWHPGLPRMNPRYEHHPSPNPRAYQDVNTQRERGFSIISIPNLVTMVPHYDLTIRASAYRPLLRLYQAINLGFLALFIIWSATTTQKGWNPFHPNFLSNKRR